MNKPVEAVLYERYTPDQALRLFGADTHALYCDGQFAVTQQHVLCFFTASRQPGSSEFRSPETFEWRPASPDADPYEMDHWFPSEVREVWSKDRKTKLRTHVLFVRQNNTDDYIYLGAAHLGSYGGMPGNVSASFTLLTRLPRELWTQFNGFDGWQIYAAHRDFEVARKDVAVFEKILSKFAKSKRSHIQLTRYEGDSLQVFTNPKCAWVMYLREPGDTGLYVTPHLPADGNDPEEVFSCTCGIDMEFSRSHTIAREQAIDIAREFFQTGALPDSVPWTDEVP